MRGELNTVYTNAEMNAIHKYLPRGEKKKLAKHLNIHVEALSRYLNIRHGQYKMPAEIYNKINEYINLKIINHGNDAAA